MNRKLLIFLSFFLAFSNLSFAKEVPVNTAKTAGYHYLLQHGASTIKSPDDLALVYTSGSSPAFFYVFSNSNSFVIVSADDGVVPVLGYSKERAFDGAHIPSSVKGFFESYDNQINYVITNKIAASVEITTDWNNLAQNKRSGTASRTTTVSPLLSCTWDQTLHYNDYCPVDAGAPTGFGGRVPTGCVATATAQVMKFWGWPATGTGFNSYATPSYGTLSANFATSTYSWASMPNNVTSTNPSVARLMSDVGISLNMQYGPTESGSYVISATSPITNCAEYALKTYFNYKPTMNGVSRSSYSDASWISLIESEMNAGRPVIYDGFGTSGGHCFVIDGYDASDNFHVNWGWGGADNGYFYMDALNPSSLGTGGGAGGFNSGQEAIIGIQPNSVAPTASLELYDYVNVSRTSIQYADTFTVISNVLNTGTTTFNGDLCIAAFDATTGTFVSYLDSIVGTSLPSGFVFGAPGFGYSGLYSIAMIPGTYNIKILYRTSGTIWTPVANGGSGLYTNATMITVYNHNFIETYTAMTSTPSPLVQGSAASITVKVYNNDTSPWADSLYMGLYNMDGTWNSDIKYIAGTSLAASTASGTLTFNTSSITATPGSYILVMWFKYSGAWYLCGADYASNPANVTVIAPAPPPDMYEVNNTAATAYDLTSTLTWASNTSHTSTPGSTIHISTDQDYYKVALPSGYSYSISARVNDVVSKDDAGTYTADVLWSYSTNGGSTWSPTYNNTMTGTINITGTTGGTVIFHVAPAFAGNTGSYLLKLGNITRTPPVSIPTIDPAAVSIYPNPTSSYITIDLSGTDAKGIDVTLTDVQGRKVLTTDISNKLTTSIDVHSLNPGVYLLWVNTDAGTITKKITVNK